MSSRYAPSRFQAGSVAEIESPYCLQRQQRPQAFARRLSSSAAAANSNSSLNIFTSGNDSLSYISFVGGGAGGSSRDFSPSRSPHHSASPLHRRPSVITTPSGGRYYHDGGEGPPIPISHSGQPFDHPTRGPPQVCDDYVLDVPHPRHYGDRSRPPAGPPFLPLSSPTRKESFVDRGGGGRAGGGPMALMEDLSELSRPPLPDELPLFRQNGSGSSSQLDHFYSPEHHRPRQHNHPPPYRNSDLGIQNAITEDDSFYRDSYQRPRADTTSHNRNSRPASGAHSPRLPLPCWMKNVEPVIDVSAPSQRCLRNAVDIKNRTGNFNLELGVPVDLIGRARFENSSSYHTLVPIHHQHEVQCRHCSLLMLVSKLTIVVQCFDCGGISPATNSSNAKHHVSTEVPSLKGGG